MAILPPPPSPQAQHFFHLRFFFVAGREIQRLWDDGDPCVGCKLELCVRASGAALLRGPEPAQSVQPAPDPGAQEALQHGGQAMGPRPQQAAETKGLTY